MKKKTMPFKKKIFLWIVLLWAVILWPGPSLAADSLPGVEVNFSSGSYQEIVYTQTSLDTLYASCFNGSSEDIVLELSSTNPNAVQITSETSLSVPVGQGEKRLFSISYQPVGVGVSDLAVKVKDKDMAYKVTIYVMPKEIKLTSITQTAFNAVTLQWEKMPGCSGYIVERCLVEQDSEYDGWWNLKGSYQNAAVVFGEDTTSATVLAEWETTYRYRVIGFVEDGARRAYTENFTYSYKDFAADRLKAELSSVTASGKTALSVSWKSMAGASAYKLYRSMEENGIYDCIYTADAGTLSYTQSVSKGITYYYKVKAVMPEGESNFSASISGFIPKKGKKKAVSADKLGLRYRSGQYGGNYAYPDDIYYYTAGGKLYAACVSQNKNVNIFQLSSSLKAKKVKTIKLAYDVWGGFYAGPDGNFYIAAGYHNFSESRTKTVIKIIQYNSRWKRGKTAEIKGGASNMFTGIYDPIHAGNLRMDMQGNMLYVTTARTMFQSSDGLRHQSDIAFWINTTTMTEEKALHAYVSHSFNQFVKLKDGNIYLLDHGDAYPRSLALTIIKDYGLKLQKMTENETSLFSFQGETGENYTGCKVGGMEVGASNVLVCGIAQPHRQSIKGISGYGYDYKYNVFLCLADKETGKTNFLWLTAYHPKNTPVTVGETRMVKLSDERFVILYSTLEKGKTKLNYVVINDTGKKIYSKKYSGMAFSGSSQPILYKGNIIWADTSYTAFYQAETKLYSIPAVY